MKVKTVVNPYRQSRGCPHPLVWILWLLLPAAALAQSYPLDSSGWSIINPSSDSRLIYVSAAGNDSTAQTYSVAQVGTNPRSPSISVNAYSTLAAAYAQMRAGYPDWIIFRRGDTFTDSFTFGGNSKGGRNATERWVFTHYGTNGNRPLLTAANWDFYGVSAHIALVGLDVHYRRRDPTSSFWVNFSAEFKVIFSAAINSSAGNILLEDCVFRNGQENLVIQGINSGTRLPNVDVRRCAVWDANDGTASTAHADRSQGIYSAWVQNLVIEECFFDRNGWNQNADGSLAGNGRSIYSHNIYLQNGSRNTTVRDNLVSRAAAGGLQARAGNYVENNLFILNPVGLFSEASTAQDEDPDNVVIDNVLVAGDDIAPTVWSGSDAGARGWGIEVHRMPEGFYEGNILLDEVSTANPFAIRLNAGSGSQPILISNNIIRNWGIGIQNQDPGSYTLSNNIVNGVNLSTGQPVTFVDGSRTLSSYLTSIGSSGDNLAFLAQARAAWLGAPRSYPANYRAGTVNNYFRAGFTLAAGNSVPAITTTSLPAATQGSAYSQALQASGGNGALTWSLASGALPAGLNLSSGGVISGTPTGTGTSTFTVRVADSDGITGASDEDTQALSIQVTATNSVPAITTTSLPAATQGSAYSQALQASGGNGALIWSLASGTLPAGLNLSSGGVISGTPTGTGTSTFTVRVADSDGITGASDEDTQALSIQVSTNGSVTAMPGGPFLNQALGSSQTGTFTVTYSATPSASPMDGLVGLSNAPVSSFGGMACLMRFNPSGNIDARNGGAYAAAATIPYSAGLTYAFRVVVNVPAHTYSIFVTPPGGSELTVGTNFAFRTDQSSVTSLNYWNLRAEPTPAGSLTVSGFNLSAGGTTPVATIAATDASAGEPSNHGQFTVTLTPAPAANVTVNLIRSGTATNGSDYNSIGTTVVVGTSGTATVPVTVINDSTPESAETVILTLASGTGYTIGVTYSATVTIADDDGGLPSPWTSQDVGAVAATGTAAHAGGTFTLEGSGADIWKTADEFRFVHQAANGDCSITARVTGVENTDNWAKAGVMIRESLGANAPWAMVSLSPKNSSTAMFAARSSSGTNAVSVTESIVSVPTWVRVTRVGNTFTGYRSTNGTSWTNMGSVTIAMGTNTYIGLAVTSHIDGTLCTGTFTDVTATP